MPAELRQTGIEALGAMPWGFHFCHFYETKQDLLDIIVPYFKAGLEANEFCLWIISASLSPAEATGALQKSIPDLDKHVADRSMEILVAKSRHRTRLRRLGSKVAGMKRPGRSVENSCKLPRGPPVLCVWGSVGPAIHSPFFGAGFLVATRKIFVAGSSSSRRLLLFKMASRACRCVTLSNRTDTGG